MTRRDSLRHYSTFLAGSPVLTAWQEPDALIVRVTAQKSREREDSGGPQAGREGIAVPGVHRLQSG